jgi:beta-glucosidase-like glycosyl hydrolase/CubicO group peptidase (beta-lactamase class C family)
MEGMTLEEKVGQMVMVGVQGHYLSRDGAHYARLEKMVRDRKTGGLILWQSDVYEAAVLLNDLQRMAKIPLLVSGDFERGPAMRIRRATSFPDAMAIAATRDTGLAYRAAFATAREVRAVGVHQNYAPVADVNTNPRNPVINTRAFGDDVRLVSSMVGAYVRGTNDGGVLSTAKHYPGHGGTGTDSHLELPLLEFSRERLERVELAPFRSAISNDVKSVMIAHLAVPALDTASLPASISPALIDGHLRRGMGFEGLVVTDAMEMQGVVRDFSASESTVRAVKAGVDIILMPLNDEIAFTSLLGAVRSGEIPESRIDSSVRRILAAKQWLGLHEERTVALGDIPASVGTVEHRLLAKQIARRAVTLLKNEWGVLPLQNMRGREIVGVILTDNEEYRPVINRPGPRFTNEPVGSHFFRLIRRRNGTMPVARLTPSCNREDLEAGLERVKKADLVLLALHVRVRTSSGRIHLPANLRRFVEAVRETGKPTVVISFGTPYVVEHFPDAHAVLCTYGDAEPLVEATVEVLYGETPTRGLLPVSVSEQYPLGSGIRREATALRREDPSLAGYAPGRLNRIDEVVIEAIRDSAFPGAQLAIGRDGSLLYRKSFGTYSYDLSSREIRSHTLFDLASLTKVIATTSAAMKLYDQGRLDLDEPVGVYLPHFSEGPKASITPRHLLTHRSGFPPFRRFFLFCEDSSEGIDSIFATPLVADPGDTTIYSDLGMITMGKVIEAITEMSLAQFVTTEFYEPLGMQNTMFNPPPELLSRIAPTEVDTLWRKRLVRGTVHDENASLLGGVSGHAGLFSTASDLSVYMQMLLNGGVYAGRRFLKASTVEEFLARRAPGQRYLGWDFRSPRGSSSGTMFSATSFGHTGFTGTSIWVDPERKLFVIFLTNRVHPTRASRKIYAVRPALHDAVIRAMEPGVVE